MPTLLLLSLPPDTQPHTPCHKLCPCHLKGHTEFKLEFAAADRLFVAAPGGSVVFVDGQAVTDECGVSAWIDFKANLPYIGGAPAAIHRPP